MLLGAVLAVDVRAESARGADQEPTGSRPAGTAVHMSDPAGDVRIQPQNQAVPSQLDYLDVLAFWVDNETIDDIEFGLQMKTLERSAEAPPRPFSGNGIVLRFHLGAAEHSILLSDPKSRECVAYLQSRYPLEEGAVRVSTRCIPGTSDIPRGIVRFNVPRRELSNESYTTFGAGHRLEGIHAFAATNPTEGSFISGRAEMDIRDRAPDTGFAPMYESALSNVTSSGQIALFTPEPIRLSNGESTTLVYPLEIANFGAADDTVLLSIQHDEPSWSLRAPPRVKVPADRTVTVPVILSMGFNHRHGDIAFFQVRAESATDPNSWSLLHLGVYWLDVPQPAGHHNKLWFHSGPAEIGLLNYQTGGDPPVAASICESAYEWISPVEDASADGAVDEPIPACPSRDMAIADNEYAAAPSAEWSFTMNPHLLIGLDFDVTQPGSLLANIDSPVAVTSAELHAVLRFCDARNATSPRVDCPGQWVEIGRGVSETAALAAGVPRTFEVPLMVAAVADIIPYYEGANLGLDLRLQTNAPTHPPNVGTSDTSPTLIVKGSELTLPLVEYHDPIDQAFQNVGALALEALAPFEKFANPGQTISFPFLLANNASSKQTIRLLVEGHNKDWARFTGEPEVRLGPGERPQVMLLVDVPFDASEGERSELFFVAENADNPNVVAVARLRATVVDPTTRIIPAEVDALTGNGSGTPFLGFIVVVVLLASVVATRRRHA